MVRALFCHKPSKTTPKSPGSLALLAFLLAGLGACATPPAPFPAPVVVGRMAEPRNGEASGLAASHRAPDLLWTHNDSGGDPVLYALATDGSVRGRLRVDGVTNDDWEDMASFELDGRSWLLAADLGDNFAQRAGIVLHLLEEPDPATLNPDRELTVRPAYSIHFVFEGGARDCEAVAVDPRERAIWLLSKRDVPARLYRLPLQAAPARQPATARLMGLVTHLRQPTALEQLVQTPASALRGMPTAMDFAPDGSAAAVLLYGDLLLFQRRAGESWPEALARGPAVLPPHGFPQAEAVAFSADGRSLFVCSERDPRLLRYALP